MQEGIQGNDSSVKGGASLPKPTKYRLACDSCQLSKIRCDQGRPKCRRCAKKSIDCIYSPAKRAGRPRTRHKSKSISGTEGDGSTSLKEYLAHMAGPSITHPASSWTPPFVPYNVLSTSESSSSSNSSSRPNTFTISRMVQAIQTPSPDNIEFSSNQQPDDDFLQGLPNLTGSQCGTPSRSTDHYYPISPGYRFTPEFLNLDFCGASWELQQQRQQRQQYEHGQHQSAPTPMLLDEGLPYLGLLTPEESGVRQHSDQFQEETAIPSTNVTNIDSENHILSSRQQIQPQVRSILNLASSSAKSCDCVANLLDHLSRHPSASPPSLTSTSAALSASRTLISYCCHTMACLNACSTRPSIALVICEAIDRVLVSLKMGNPSLWTATRAPLLDFEDRESISPQSSSSSLSSSISCPNRSGMLSSMEEEEHEPLRCGSLPIQGADRRVVVQVLLVKRVLEIKSVLEQLRDTLISDMRVDGSESAKSPQLELCADVVSEFAKKVAEKAETVRFQM